MRKLLDKTFLKFILVGVVNTLFGTAVMFVFYNVLGLSYWLSSASNYFFGSILSFFLNKRFTFENQDRSFLVVLKFTLNIAVCYGIAYGMAKPLASAILSGTDVSLKLQENIAMLVGMCLFVGLNYLGQRFFAFAKKEEEQ
jgi:putative flippase GtrA